MNCQLCQKELEAYREGRLPESTRIQVEEHLKACQACSESYSLLRVADQVIEDEKSQEFNLYLSTRVMSKIGEMEISRQAKHVPVYRKILKPALISVSVAAAVLVGVIAGNLYKPAGSANEIPVELLYMNDAAMESVYLFAND